MRTVVVKEHRKQPPLEGEKRVGAGEGLRGEEGMDRWVFGGRASPGKETSSQGTPRQKCP